MGGRLRLVEEVDSETKGPVGARSDSGLSRGNQWASSDQWASSGRLAEAIAADHPSVSTLTQPHLHRLGHDDRTSQRVRVVDATLRCVARRGVVKTTADDIAREAGISRATLYRAFPGGRDAVFAAVVDTEIARFFSALAVVLGEAISLEEVLVEGMVEAQSLLMSHPALRYLREHEPGQVYPRLAFGPMDRLLLAASAFAAPFLGRWLEPEEAARAAEWATRIVLWSCLATPASVSVATRSDARRLVRTFMLPGVEALRAVPAARQDTKCRVGEDGTEGLTPVGAGGEEQ